MKYLVLIAVLLLVYLLWRHERAQEQREEESAARPPAAPPPTALPPKDMVRCPVCAVHLPREEAVADAKGRLFCSPEHRRIGGA